MAARIVIFVTDRRSPIDDGESVRPPDEIEACFVVQVTDGFTIAFPPEIYADSGRAGKEARRWAEGLSSMNGRDVTSVGDDLVVGDLRVSVTPAARPVEAARWFQNLWVGTYWSWHGFPDPLVELLHGRGDALAWVIAPLGGELAPSSTQVRAWSITATFRSGHHWSEAEAHRAKVVI